MHRAATNNRTDARDLRATRILLKFASIQLLFRRLPSYRLLGMGLSIRLCVSTFTLIYIRVLFWVKINYKIVSAALLAYVTSFFIINHFYSLCFQNVIGVQIAIFKYTKQKATQMFLVT